MKYIIRWNSGYGDDYHIIDCADQESAEQDAYDAWREEAERGADYDAVEYTKELSVELGLEDEDEEE